MEEHNPHKIEITREDGEKINFIIAWDADIAEWQHIFRVILYWLTFQPKTIEDYLPSEDSFIPKTEE